MVTQTRRGALHPIVDILDLIGEVVAALAVVATERFSTQQRPGLVLIAHSAKSAAHHRGAQGAVLPDRRPALLP